MSFNDFANPANPMSPLSPANPANPMSPLWDDPVAEASTVATQPLPKPANSNESPLPAIGFTVVATFVLIAVSVVIANSE